MNVYIKFGEILSFGSQNIERKRKSDTNQGPLLKGHNAINLRKMTGNNPNIDLVSINAYTKFDEIVSIGSQDIGRKRNYDRMTDNPNPV